MSHHTDLLPQIVFLFLHRNKTKDISSLKGEHQCCCCGGQERKRNIKSNVVVVLGSWEPWRSQDSLSTAPLQKLHFISCTVTANPELERPLQVTTWQGCIFTISPWSVMVGRKPPGQHFLLPKKKKRKATENSNKPLQPFDHWAAGSVSPFMEERLVNDPGVLMLQFSWWHEWHFLVALLCLSAALAFPLLLPPYDWGPV